MQAIGNDRDDDTYQDVAVLEEEPDSDIDDFEPGSDDDDPIRVPGTNKRKANSTKNPGPSQKKKKK